MKAGIHNLVYTFRVILAICEEHTVGIGADSVIGQVRRSRVTRKHLTHPTTNQRYHSCRAAVLEKELSRQMTEESLNGENHEICLSHLS